MTLTMLAVMSILFALTHMGLSHDPLRSGMINKLGKSGFNIIYYLASFTTFGGAAWLFVELRGTGPQLWLTPAWLYPVIYLLTLLAFVLLVLSVATPSPTGMMPAKMEPRGVLRITRHPMNMGFSCFCLAHLIANGHLGDVVFFGSLFVVGFVGAFHQDRRKAREGGDDFKAFQEQTSIIPFAAVISGRTRLEAKEFSVLLLGGAVVGFVAFLFLHGRLFGATPW